MSDVYIMIIRHGNTFCITGTFHWSMGYRWIPFTNMTINTWGFNLYSAVLLGKLLDKLLGCVTIKHDDNSPHDYYRDIFSTEGIWILTGFLPPPVKRALLSICHHLFKWWIGSEKAIVLYLHSWWVFSPKNIRVTRSIKITNKYKYILHIHKHMPSNIVFLGMCALEIMSYGDRRLGHHYPMETLSVSTGRLSGPLRGGGGDGGWVAPICWTNNTIASDWDATARIWGH